MRKEKGESSLNVPELALWSSLPERE